MGKKTDVPASRTRSRTSAKSKMATNSDRATGAIEAGITVDVLTALVDQMKNMAAPRPGYSVETFTGDMVTSDSWLEQYERYARLQNMTDQQKADAFAFHVSGLALTWHQSLEEEVKNEWPILRAHFLQRFRVSQQALWRQERDLYKRRQQPGQSIADFTASILNAARGLQLTDSQKVRLIMGGLHETVAPFVEQSQPQSVQELLQCPAALSAMTAPAKAEITTEQQIATVASAIQEKIVAQLETRNHYRDTRDHTPERSPGRGRPTARYESPPRDIGRNSQRGNYGRRPQTSGRTVRFESPRRDSDRWTQENRTQRRPHRQDQPCHRCGRWCSTFYQGCPAIGRQCYACHQYDHFRSQCQVGPRQ